jgi:hypothetical protein
MYMCQYIYRYILYVYIYTHTHTHTREGGGGERERERESERERERKRTCQGVVIDAQEAYGALETLSLVVERRTVWIFLRP